jgi:hypothetical protein
VHPEAAFLAGYAAFLVGLAAGLEWLGNRSTEPESSRMLLAGRPRAGSRSRTSDAGWPQSEVPVFHLGVSAVALAAALLLGAAGIVRHHRPIELVVQLAVLGLATKRTLGVVSRLRPFAARPHS